MPIQIPPDGDPDVPSVNQEPIRQSRPGGGPPGGGPGGGGGGFGGGLVGGGLNPTPFRSFQGLGADIPLVMRKRGFGVPGVTPGPPGRSDTVPAMLSPGEIVMNNNVTQNPQVAQQLLHMNQMGLSPQQQHQNIVQSWQRMGGQHQATSSGSISTTPAAPIGMEKGGEVPCPNCGYCRGGEVQGFGFGGMVKGIGSVVGHTVAAPFHLAAEHPKWALAAAALLTAPLWAPAAVAGVGAGAGALATTGAEGAVGAESLAAEHPALAKMGEGFFASRANQMLNPQPPPQQYQQPYPAPPQQGFALGGMVGQTGMFPGIGRPAPTMGPTPAAPAAPPGPWDSHLGQNPDLQGARGAGYFDPRGNQMLIGSMNEAAQGTADSLVRRQMASADLGGLDPAQRAVARMQAQQQAGRGVQDIMAQTRAGALQSQDDFYKGLYGQEQQAEQARLAAQRAQDAAMQQIHYTGLENRSTKKTKGR